MARPDQREATAIPGVVVIGSSAGGVEALQTVLGMLPASFPAPVVIAQHLATARRYQSRLCEVLGRVSALDVRWAHDGAPLEAGRAYVAPQDGHVAFSGEGELRIEPAVDRPRPQIDRLFRSAARVWRERTIGVVLSGFLDDGAAGARAVADAGGVVYLQDRATSLVFDMPRAALGRGVGALVLPVNKIAPALVVALAPGARTWFSVRPGSPYLATA